MEGKILKRKLLELNKTQKELSELLGITAQSVNAILSAKDVRSGTIERIAQALNVPVSFFFGEEVGHNAVASGNKSVAAINSNVSSPTAAVLEERVKSLETLVTEKERLIKVYEKMVEDKV